jgi:hypothetical protein
MKSTVLVRMLGVAFLVAAGCGSNTPAGGISGKGGNGGGGGGSGGTTSSGSAGTMSNSGAAGTMANGGTTATGVGGNASGVGGNASGVGGIATGGTTGRGGTTGAGGSKVGNPQCSDGIDNDGDGRIDYDDPECVGPLDNDESSFATGIPGDNMDACKQDCFFDGNSGMGDDHCLWQLKCDPMSTTASCPYDPQFAAQHSMDCSVTASQSQQCIDSCRKLVPNGCDCFGCCVVPGAPTPIRLAATCTAKDFGDPTKCPACTQVTQCNNPCEHCEICIGKPTLPADCTATPDGGTDSGTDSGTPPPPNNCGSDYVPCGPGTATPADGCGPSYGCVTGCCIPTGI